MNYRHAFHAGNHADVFKHIVLTRLIALMSRKEQPFAYIDTHAGLGLYDLSGDQATRTGEWLEGIARLWQATDRPALTDDYVKVINRLNAEGELRYYPGSPELARRLMRQQDRVLLNEKHPDDGQLLKDNMKKDPRVAVHLGEITTEIAPLDTFYYAEAYHQQYLAKNPQGYCGLGGTGVCLTP
ncbi:MAG: 23S rRNA (adenine(2030)-N(6))-methyltransferase RlmJ [Proteobacteria bacterium]|nr:MAG: 23S rRNA (adenine(2030)-N(6))-methyltransferase RlmJ [Pseudomonadota bacterium]